MGRRLVARKAVRQPEAAFVYGVMPSSIRLVPSAIQTLIMPRSSLRSQSPPFPRRPPSTLFRSARRPAPSVAAMNVLESLRNTIHGRSPGASSTVHKPAIAIRVHRSRPAPSHARSFNRVRAVHISLAPSHANPVWLSRQASYLAADSRPQPQCNPFQPCRRGSRSSRVRNVLTLLPGYKYVSQLLNVQLPTSLLRTGTLQAPSNQSTVS